MRLETLEGSAARAALPALTRLRITVFAEWPYLYDGDAGQEEAYLATLVGGRDAAVVIAWDGAEPVGMATCQPMRDSYATVREAFCRRGLDPARFCYFGESVLLPAFRGQGIGVGFFHAREAHARRVGLGATAFCSVVRNANDPRQPRDHVPLDGFWRRRGYAPRPDLSCIFHWREHGDAAETPHALGFWVKDPL
ncbi:GNAT family N-acetyltransferase [Belnapia sp. F-4-1]|uniref:GNAT family N-acetyltransferase n=1 Tax=Belnapia sp. F-4-1 TaxID=1545443 RepID=UPI0005BCFFA8|nr:GNAT family N-acetyltransferase [Belnapia sp. F-4-1]